MSFPPIFIRVVVLLLIQLIRPASTEVIYTNFSYPSFDPNSLHLKYSGNASATADGSGVIDVTKPERGDVDNNIGRVTYAEPVHLYDRASRSVADIVTTFTFFIDGDVMYSGDGLTFFLCGSNSSVPSNSFGKWLGLGNSTTINQFVAVEIDTYQSDSVLDPNGNHMGIDINTVVSNVTVDWQWDSDTRLNGEASVVYNSTTQILFAKMINKNLQASGGWNVSIPIDLTTVLPEYVFVGFSASAYESSESHQISSWNFESKLVIPDAPPPQPSLLPPTLATDQPAPPVISTTQRGGGSKLVRNIVATCLVFLSMGAIAFE